jgi:hypothetical protein
MIVIDLVRPWNPVPHATKPTRPTTSVAPFPVEMPTPKRPNSSLSSRPLEDIIAPLTAILGEATSSSTRNSPRLLPAKLEGEELILSLYEARAEEVPAHLP